MYAKTTPRTPINVRSALACLTLGLAGLLSFQGNHAAAQQSVIKNITNSTERLELTVNSSRILTLEKRIPKMVVNNPELVTVTALSANQIQLAARKPGVTQVNLWDEEGKVYSVDVTIYGDVRELQLALKRLFPASSVKVVRLTNSLVLEGFVERPEVVSPIIRLAEDYAPKIINNITVGGVQQVMLKVKVMEVSRTKLRALGVDWDQMSGASLVSSSIASVSTAAETFRFGVVDGGDSFFAVLEALQRNNLSKVLADPTITTVSGRPAHFNVGGELPIIIPSGLGQTTVQYKKFGTQVDFLPIVLGNGNIRLEVRPRVSEIDDTRSVTINGFTVPALKVREVDTGVELKAGQTLALAGLVQTRVEAQERSLPFLGDIPFIGAAFRKVEEEVNEIELLIMVTPEFVDGMEPHEVPPCGPGMETVSPTNRQLYFGGQLEVPTYGVCAPGSGCGQNGCQSASCNSCASGAVETIISDGVYQPDAWQSNGGQSYGSPIPMEAAPPTLVDPINQVPVLQPVPQGVNPGPPSKPVGDPTASRPTTPRGQPWLRQRMPAQFSRDGRSYRSANQPRVNSTTTPGLIGPLGYDVEN